MKENKVKIEKFLTNQLNNNAKTVDIMLLPITDNVYVLFGKYTITVKNNQYTVQVDHSSTERVFNTLKNAVTWCVYHNKGLVFECKQIESLDFKISSIDAEILGIRKLIKTNKNSQNIHIYLSKLVENEHKLKTLTKKLTNYINKSKSWQQKKFDSAKSASKR